MKYESNELDRGLSYVLDEKPRRFDLMEMFLRNGARLASHLVPNVRLLKLVQNCIPDYIHTTSVCRLILKQRDNHDILKTIEFVALHTEIPPALIEQAKDSAKTMKFHDYLIAVQEHRGWTDDFDYFGVFVGLFVLNFIKTSELEKKQLKNLGYFFNYFPVRITSQVLPFLSWRTKDKIMEFLRCVLRIRGRSLGKDINIIIINHAFHE